MTDRYILLIKYEPRNAHEKKMSVRYIQKEQVVNVYKEPMTHFHATELTDALSP